MGYDMSLVNPPEQHLAGKQAYDDAYDELTRLQKEHGGYNESREVPEVVEARRRWLTLEDPTYFRLNIFGMSKYREAMESIGMMAFDDPMPDWPDTPDGYDEWEEDDPRYIAFRAECSEVTDAETGGVLPGYKFSTNDGWHVTASECQRTLEVWDRMDKREQGEFIADEIGTDDDNDTYWFKWVTYLRVAAASDGFRVW